MVKEVRKKSLGRQKIEIKKIQNEEARQVCFSKRRSGLFKKASEISILCGAKVAVVVFSLAGKPFSFGHPSVNDVTYRIMDGKPLKVAIESSASSLMAGRINRDLNDKLTDLGVMLERERQRRAALEKELKRSEEEMSLLGLMEYERRLLELKGEAAKWVDKRATYRSKYEVVGGNRMSNEGDGGGFMYQFMPVKNDMVTDEQGVGEYIVKKDVHTDSNGYFLTYGNFGGEGGGHGFGNNPFFGGFQ